MPNPIKKQIADQIIALLEGYAPFAAAVLPGNVANQATDGWLRNMLARAPGQYPRVSLTNGRFTHSGFQNPTPMTYGQQNALLETDLAQWIVVRTLHFNLTITGKDLKSTNIDPAEEAAQNALLAGGPRLGLGTLIASWGPLTANQSQITDGPDKVLRLQSVIDIPVNTEQIGTDALT